MEPAHYSSLPINIKMKVLLTAVFFLLSWAAKATDISFVVYHSKGAVSKSSSKQVLKKGDKIFFQEVLVIGDKASLVLICSNYKVIQISKKGSYTVKNLLGECNKEQANYSSSYFKYVWEQLTHPHGSPEKDPGEYMKNIGAVSRGCDMAATNIKLDTLNYASGSLPVYWKSTFKNPEVRIYDVFMDGGALMKMKLTQNLPIQTGKLFMNLDPGTYYWQITEEDGTSCERNYVKIFSASEYKKAVNIILQSVPVTTPSETAFSKAFLMEENFFMAEAYAYYELATKLNPTNKLYKNSLLKFYDKDF